MPRLDDAYPSAVLRNLVFNGHLANLAKAKRMPKSDPAARRQRVRAAAVHLRPTGRDVQS